MSAINPSAAPSTNMGLVQKLRLSFSGEERGVWLTAAELQRILGTVPGKQPVLSANFLLQAAASRPVTAKELLDRLEEPACWDVAEVPL